MQFTKEDKILIKNLFELKGYTAMQLVREFPSKGWNVGSVYKLLQKLRLLGPSTVVPAAANDAAPAQLTTLIDEAIDQWRTRLRACRKARGHHFEHLL